MISAGGEGLLGFMPDLCSLFLSLDPAHLSHLSDISFRRGCQPHAERCIVSVHSIFFFSRVSVVLAGVGQPLYDG